MVPITSLNTFSIGEQEYHVVLVDETSFADPDDRLIEIAVKTPTGFRVINSPLDGGVLLRINLKLLREYTVQELFDKIVLEIIRAAEKLWQFLFGDGPGEELEEWEQVVKAIRELKFTNLEDGRLNVE